MSFAYQSCLIILYFFFHSAFNFQLLFHRENVFLHLIEDDEHLSKVDKLTLKSMLFNIGIENYVPFPFPTIIPFSICVGLGFFWSLSLK